MHACMHACMHVRMYVYMYIYEVGLRVLGCAECIWDCIGLCGSVCAGC